MRTAIAAHDLRPEGLNFEGLSIGGKRVRGKRIRISCMCPVKCVKPRAALLLSAR